MENAENIESIDRFQHSLSRYHLSPFAVFDTLMSIYYSYARLYNKRKPNKILLQYENMIELLLICF